MSDDYTFGRPTKRQQAARTRQQLGGIIPDTAAAATGSGVFSLDDLTVSAANILECRVTVRNAMLGMVTKAIQQAMAGDTKLMIWFMERFFGRSREANETFEESLERLAILKNQLEQPGVPTHELLQGYGMEGLHAIRRQARQGNLDAAKFLARYAIGEPEQSFAVAIQQLPPEAVRGQLIEDFVRGGMDREQAERIIDGAVEADDGEDEDEE